LAQAKLQSDQQISQEKMQADQQKMIVDAQIKKAESEQAMELERQKMVFQMQLEEMKINAQIELEKMRLMMQEQTRTAQLSENQEGPELITAINQLSQQMVNRPITIQMPSANKRIVKNPDGSFQTEDINGDPNNQQAFGIDPA